MLPVFKTYIRPMVEYNSTVWSPYLLKDVRVVETVQRRFTKRIKNYNNYTYKQRCEILDLDTLELRRLKTDLVEYFKILKGYSHLKKENFFAVKRTTYNLRRHHLSLSLGLVRTDARKNVFNCRAINAWNSLPDRFFITDSVDTFREHLKSADLQHFLNLS